MKIYAKRNLTIILRSKFSPHRLLAQGASIRQYIGAGVAFLIALSLYRPLPLAISVSAHFHINLSHHLIQHIYLPPYILKIGSALNTEQFSSQALETEIALLSGNGYTLKKR